MPSWNWPARRYHHIPAPAVSPTRAQSAPSAIPDDRERLPNAPYLLPKDALEQQRLDFQHACLYTILSNHYMAPLPPKVTTILDVGTGTGVWSTDMARLFPQAHIVGVDISAALLEYTSSAACTFCLADILQGLPFPDEQFEYVHQRFLVAAIPTVNWPAVIQELVRVARPGGWIELVEIGLTIQQAGPKTTHLLDWIEEISLARGFDMRTLPIGKLFRQMELEYIETYDVFAPLGDWAGNVGTMFKANILSAWQAIKGLYCAQANVSPAHFETMLKLVAQEWEERHASYVIHVAHARRPLA